MESLKQINCKFETSLAYHEMCADDVMFDYYTESEGNPSKDADATKSIWARIKEIVAKIFKSLGEALGKIGIKISEMFKGKDPNKELEEIKSFVNENRDEVKEIEIDCPDFEAQAKVIDDAEKEIEKIEADLSAHKEVSAEDVKNKMKDFDEKMKVVHKKHTGRNIAIVLGSLIAVNTIVAAFTIKPALRIAQKKILGYNKSCDSATDITNADAVPVAAAYRANVEKHKASTAGQAGATIVKIRGRIAHLHTKDVPINKFAGIDDRLEKMKRDQKMLNRSVSLNNKRADWELTYGNKEQGNKYADDAWKAGTDAIAMNIKMKSLKDTKQRASKLLKDEMNDRKLKRILG